MSGHAWCEAVRCLGPRAPVHTPHSLRQCLPAEICADMRAAGCAATGAATCAAGYAIVQPQYTCDHGWKYVRPPGRHFDAAVYTAVRAAKCLAKYAPCVRWGLPAPCITRGRRQHDAGRWWRLRGSRPRTLLMTPSRAWRRQAYTCYTRALSEGNGPSYVRPSMWPHVQPHVRPKVQPRVRP